MASGLFNLIESIKLDLLDLGPNVAVILIVIGGLVYGIAQTQPAQTRGKYQSLGIGIVVGGIIIAAIVGAAELIAKSSANLLV
ncbi:MAG: hypothetical protein ABIH83_01480 [Candidatus Micrarchaeota archaeon]